LVAFYRSFYCINAALKTIIINRVGDIFFLSSLVFFLLNNSSYIFLFLLLVSVARKRAQYPFSSWLPAAIAAPTPISALVHSSTLVTAGI
jgi:NADH-ubiquinone oxidoreductase chain 5